MRVFDRRSVRQHRDRAAKTLPDHDFLLREVGERLLDRLDDVRRSFPLALDLGCHRGELGTMLAGRGGIETLVQCDLSEAMVRAATDLRAVADEEALPFADGSFDLVLSAMSLHWVNDLPGTLLQLRRILRPDGLLLMALLGGETLKELRRALADAEIAGEGGLSPRVSPFADVRDIGNLLQRAGFALPVVESDTITVSYGDPLSLLADLHGMGESNAVLHRRKTLMRRKTLLAALQRYRDGHGHDGRVPATFQVIFAVAWAPDQTQPQPLRPGSAVARLADALQTDEFPSGDPARP
ncbi:MAG: methyltransferase domain-containing protein [Rhodospirillales bacterium]